MRASDKIDETRLWQRHVDMAKLGGLPKGGVNRQALSAEDAAARLLLGQWAQARGYDVFSDPIGNLHVRRAGTENDAAPVLTGSHMDSQPTGGKYDGIYGVLAGFEALEALDDAGIRTKRPVGVVAWMNEEGSRFQPGAMGSAVWAGHYDLARMLAVEDRVGVKLADALAQTLVAAPCRTVGEFDRRFHAYIEAHIEQGPRLEADAKTIGVVTGIQGSQRYTIDIFGEEAHAGTTPLRVRKDALKSAVAAIQALERHMHDPADIVRFTVGRFECRPGSPNTVPGQVHFTIDFRHPESAVLARLGDAIDKVVQASVGPVRGKGRAGRRRGADGVRRQDRRFGARCDGAPGFAVHGHAVRRRTRRDACGPARAGRHDLRAVRARHQPQRSRSREPRRPCGRCARAGRLPARARRRVIRDRRNSNRRFRAPCR
jgi:N-carbamoyl-L-amino-acid hydrolase